MSIRGHCHAAATLGIALKLFCAREGKKEKKKKETKKGAPYADNSTSPLSKTDRNATYRCIICTGCFEPRRPKSQVRSISIENFHAMGKIIVNSNIGDGV